MKNQEKRSANNRQDEPSKTSGDKSTSRQGQTDQGERRDQRDQRGQREQRNR